MSAMDQDDDEFLYGNHSSAFLPSITTMVPTPVSSSPTVPGLSVIAPSPGPASVAKQDHSTPAALPTQLEHEELEEGEEEDQEEVEVSDDEDVPHYPHQYSSLPHRPNKHRRLNW
jgi:hypothetical protein